MPFSAFALTLVTAIASVPLPLNPAGPTSVYDTPTPVYAWQGSFQSQNVTFASDATGAQLFGVVFAPSPLPSAPVPAVLILPGSVGGVQAYYQWSARDLAGHGYVAITVDPQGVGQSQTFGAAGCDPSDTADPCPGVPYQNAWNWTDAGESAIDFLGSAQNPFRSVTDTTRIGAAGHSLGARAVSWLQSVDTRISAVVAWDNLATDIQGDEGSPSGGGVIGGLDAGNVGSAPVTARVPSLGEASDLPPLSDPTAYQGEAKKTAFDAWHAAGIPSFEVVWHGQGHDDPWVETKAEAATREPLLENSEYYTRAWFDLFLLGDQTAVSRLMATTVNGQDRNSLLSTRFLSAAYLPASGVDCADLTTC